MVITGKNSEGRGALTTRGMLPARAVDIWRVAVCDLWIVIVARVRIIVAAEWEIDLWTE